MADNGNGQPKNFEEAMAVSLTKLISRKVGIVCFAIYGIISLAGPIAQATDWTVRCCLVGLAVIIGTLACYAFRGQMKLDTKELEITGHDLPDNGNGGNHVGDPTEAGPGAVVPDPGTATVGQQ